MNKALLPPIFLIIVGNFLEIYYYSFRFTNDSIPLWLAIIIGIGLTGLLTIATAFRKKPASWFLIITLVAYSIFATSAGQAFSLVTGQEQKAAKVNNAQIGKLEDEKTRKESRYQKIADMVDQSIETFEDAWTWRNTTARYEKDLKELDTEISDIENQIRSMMNPEIGEDETNIYYFYSRLFGWDRKWLQFWLQTILSAFIAFMAPFGIIILPVKRRRRQSPDYKPYIEKWVSYNWIGIRTGKSDYILSKAAFMDFSRSKGDRFTDTMYRVILKAAIKTKCVDRGNKLCYSEQDAIKKIYEEMRR